MSAMDPTGSEIQQQEIPEYSAVRVQVEGPVKVQTLPAIIASFRLIIIPFDGQAHQILKKDPRRSRVFMRGLGGTTWLGTVESQATSKQGFEMAAQVNIEMRHGDEVWGMADSVDVRMSIMQELWAE